MRSVDFGVRVQKKERRTWQRWGQDVELYDSQWCIAEYVWHFGHAA